MVQLPSSSRHSGLLAHLREIVGTPHLSLAALLTRQPPCCPSAPAVPESYMVSFAPYKAEFTRDAGGAMLDRDAVAAIKGVKVGCAAGRHVVCPPFGAPAPSALRHCGRHSWEDTASSNPPRCCRVFVVPSSAEFLTFHLGLFPAYVELSPYFFPPQYRLQYEPTAAEFLTFTWDGSEGAFKTQEEAKAAFLEVLKKVRGRCRVFARCLTLPATTAHLGARGCGSCGGHPMLPRCHCLKHRSTSH